MKSDVIKRYVQGWYSTLNHSTPMKEYVANMAIGINLSDDDVVTAEENPPETYKDFLDRYANYIEGKEFYNLSLDLQKSSHWESTYRHYWAKLVENLVRLGVDPLWGKVVIPDEFFRETNFTKYTIPDYILTVGNDSFKDSKLVSITLPEKIKTIQHRSFIGCKDLVEVNILNKTMSIGKDAFAYCTSLRDIYYNGTASEWKDLIENRVSDRATSWPTDKLTIHCTDGAWFYGGVVKKVLLKDLDLSNFSNLEVPVEVEFIDGIKPLNPQLDYFPTAVLVDAVNQDFSNMTNPQDNLVDTCCKNK